MIVRPAVPSDTESILNLYNAISGEPGILYKPLTKENFADIFASPGRKIICAEDSGVIAGFAAGVACPERNYAYITYVGTTPGYRRHSIGSATLAALEEKLRSFIGIDKIEIVFRNPASLPWFIPDGSEADHPCAPGVDVTSAAYGFFKKNGYAEWTRQNSYYQNLSDYREPSDVSEKRAALLTSGIEITLYDTRRHRGLAELFDDIKNPGWKQHVLSNTDKPIIVAADKEAGGLVCGYTGPLTVDQGGRGNFCGIGTLNAYRGRGIGKVVFCEMCRRHAVGGAKFMSLYTGDTNPARNIYESAGFKIVRTWANMRKELK